MFLFELQPRKVVVVAFVVAVAFVVCVVAVGAVVVVVVVHIVVIFIFILFLFFFCCRVAKCLFMSGILILTEKKRIMYLVSFSTI